MYRIGFGLRDQLAQWQGLTSNHRVGRYQGFYNEKVPQLTL